MKKSYSKSIVVLNILVLFALAVIACIAIGFSIYSLFPSKPKAEVICDTAKEVPREDKSRLGFASQKFQAELKQLMLSPDAKIVLVSSAGQSALIKPIADPSDNNIISTSSTGTDNLVLSSQKKLASEVPLGWEMKIEESKTTKPSDYAISLRYSSDVPVELGVTWRDGDTVVSGETLARLEPTNDWTDQVVPIKLNQTGLTPSLTLGSNNVGKLTVTDVKVGQLPNRNLDKGLVTIAFDDGWKSVYDVGRPLLNKYKLPTTQFIVSDYSLSSAENVDYMNIDQVRQMQDDGHEIASHSLAHCDATAQDDARLTDSINRSQLQFSHVFGVAPKIYAHPFGSYDDRVLNDLSSSFNYIRSSDEGLNDAYFDPQNIHIMSVEAGTTTDEINTWLKQAETQHQWLVLLYHRIGESGEYNISQAQLDEQLGVISRTQGVEVVTVSQAIERITAR